MGSRLRHLWHPTAVRLSSFRLRLTLRTRRSWTRLRRSRRLRRLQRETRLLQVLQMQVALQQIRVQQREQALHPLLTVVPQPAGLEEPRLEESLMPQPPAQVLPLTPGSPEPTANPPKVVTRVTLEPEPEPQNPVLEIAQRLGLPPQPTSPPSSES